MLVRGKPTKKKGHGRKRTRDKLILENEKNNDLKSAIVEVTNFSGTGNLVFVTIIVIYKENLCIQ